MRKAVLKNNRSITTVLVVLAFLLIMGSFIVDNEDFYIAAICVVWLTGVNYCLCNIYKRVFFLFFLLSFFNFLIGRSLLILLRLYKEDYRYIQADSISGQRIVLISIVVLVVSYVIIECIFYKNNDILSSERNAIEVRKISKTIYYITLIFLLISTIGTILYVIKNGYASIYVDTSAKVNIFIKKIGDLCPYMFYIFLSTMPTKKEAKLPIITYLGYLVLTLGTGARFDFVIGVLVIFVYCLVRNNVGYAHEIWITKKYFVKIFILAVALMMMFTIYNRARFGAKVNSKNPIKLFTSFVYDQGVNININKRIFKYKEIIPEDRIYSFDSVINFYERNIEGRFFGNEYYKGASEEKALNGNSLADTLAYIMYKKNYLKGIGGGSCYIAEVYHDFKILGLVAFNIVISAILLIIRRCYDAGFIKFTIAMSIFTGLLKIPRARADSFLIRMIDPMLWISIFLVMLLLVISIRKIGKDT